jgi:NTE family protein
LLKENRKGEETNKNNNNIFDVIAGTSGGAINASIIVSHVLEKRKQKFDIEDSWGGTLKKLLDFWNHISSDPDYNKWGPYSIFGEIVQEPFLFAPESSLMPLNCYRWKWPPDESTWKSRWDKAHTIDKYVANGESARRYYSAKEYLYTGAENVFRRSATEHDNRFFDDFVAPTNTWYHYDNTPLRKSIEHYVTFPIGTSSFFEEKGKKEQDKLQPRLLMVSVDVETGAIVTFDSYEKDKDGVRWSEFEDYAKEQKKVNIEDKKIVMRYSKGINIDHVVASSSVPINYSYAEVNMDYDDVSKGTRKFWDGGLLSNTPLRELIQSHENYWSKVYDREESIPDLRVYIANIWPIGSRSRNNSIDSNESTNGNNDGNNNNVPSDQDGVKNRLYDLKFQDKTPHEEKIAYLIRDYIDFASQLKKRAEASQVDISDILNERGKSKHRDGNERTYHELIERKVRINSVTRIQRKWDPNDVSSKLHDYSSETVSNLITHGVKETLEEMANKEKDLCVALEEFIDILNKEKESEQLAETRSNDGYNYKILRGHTIYDVMVAAALEIQTKMDCK